MTTTWTRTNTTPIRDQAAARGEPVPVGKTVDEIKAMGYEIGDGASPFAVLLEAPESPTGYVLAFPNAKMEELLDVDRVESLDEETCVRVVGGVETFGREAIVTAAWLRKHQILAIATSVVPGWATVRSVTLKDGYVLGVQWDRIPAQAPTDAAFDEESARRVALGLPALEDWRRPDKHKFRIATMAWMSDVIGELQDVSGGDVLAPAEPPKEP